MEWFEESARKTFWAYAAQFSNQINQNMVSYEIWHLHTTIETLNNILLTEVFHRPQQSDLNWHWNFWIFHLPIFENDNFPPTWTICISNESWNHSKFIFATKKCYCVWNFLKKFGFQNFFFLQKLRQKYLNFNFFQKIS